MLGSTIVEARKAVELSAVIAGEAAVREASSRTNGRIISAVGVASPMKYPLPDGSLHLPFGFQCHACTNKSVFCR